MFSLLQQLLKLFKEWRKHYVAAGGFVIIAILFRSFEPRIVQYVVDFVIVPSLNNGLVPEHNQVTGFIANLIPNMAKASPVLLLLAIGAIYIVIAAVRSGLLFVANTLKAHATENAIKSLRDELFGHIQKLPMRYFTVISRGEIIQRCTGDIATLRNFMMSKIVDLIRLVAVFGFAFLMMLTIDPLYAVISVALAPLMFAMSFMFYKRIRQVWQEHESEADALNAIVQDNINGIRVVKAFANEAHEIARFAIQNKRNLAVGMRDTSLQTVFHGLTDLLFYLQVILSLGFGGYFAATGRITLGELTGCYSYILMASWPMRNIGKILSKTSTTIVALERINEIFHAKEERRSGQEPSTILQGDIEFRNVSFAYDATAETPVLQNISFHIAPGETIGLIGATGAGKSTIVRLLLGLYEPDKGKILIDGVDSRELSKRDIRRRIGLVPQTAFLFSTSVMKNISYAKPDAAEPEVDVAANIARVSDFKNILVNGFDTLVGEKGVTLSGGQKQRVSLARTLLTQPEILVLDDVTSAVDNRTEKEIFSGLEEQMKTRTTIVISHRIASLRTAGRILVLEGGRLVQEGSPKQLERKEGYFQQICKLQSAMNTQ